MKKITFVLLGFLSFHSLAQSQIGNADMEQWDNVGAPNEEPRNWNSFKTGTGPFSGFANKQVERSSNIRAGATGMYCARIWSTSVLGIVANGNMTCGRINMGSTTPANAANYNYSQIADTLYSEACPLVPDSLVFWAKYTPTGAGQNARVHTLVHDNYETRDPIDANSQSHILATAELNYPSTNGEWVRFSVPFVPTANTGLIPAFILTTFTTNSTPGGGANNDEVLIDDISLVYNSGAGIHQNSLSDFGVSYANGALHFTTSLEGNVKVVAMNGAVVYDGNLSPTVTVTLGTGIYFTQFTDKKGHSIVNKFAVN